MLHQWCKGRLKFILHIAGVKTTIGLPAFKTSENVNGQFSDTNIASAVQDVQENGIGYQEASQKYGIHHSLWSSS